MMHLRRLERDLAKQGWHLARQRGSHRHYRNARGQRITVAQHAGRELTWRHVQAIRRDVARLADATAP